MISGVATACLPAASACDLRQTVELDDRPTQPQSPCVLMGCTHMIVQPPWPVQGGVSAMTAMGHVWTVPRCKRNLTISEAFGCGHVFGLLSLGGLPLSRCSRYGRWATMRYARTFAPISAPAATSCERRVVIYCSLSATRWRPRTRFENSADSRSYCWCLEERGRQCILGRHPRHSLECLCKCHNHNAVFHSTKWRCCPFMAFASLSATWRNVRSWV